MQFSATAPLFAGCASACGRVSKTQLTPGSTEAACHFLQFGFRVCFGCRTSNFGFLPGVVADKECTCPASKPMRERYPPTPPAFALSSYGLARHFRMAHGAQLDSTTIMGE